MDVLCIIIIFLSNVTLWGVMFHVVMFWCILLVVSHRRMYVSVLLQIIFSYQLKLHERISDSVRWIVLFLSCSEMLPSDWSACYHPEHGRRRGFTHSWSRNNKRAVWGTCRDGGWEHPVQAGTGLYTVVMASYVNI